MFRGGGLTVVLLLLGNPRLLVFGETPACILNWRRVDGQESVWHKCNNEENSGDAWVMGRKD